MTDKPELDLIIELLKEIRDSIAVFKDFVLEVTPQDAEEDIAEIKN
jgi:hypothetical protein|tara:strand:- start:4486 stop:4623 length:138 start_codon:yes stop_codon:yes gene_type:complete